MIINPMFFYLMQVSESIGMAMTICGPLLLLASLIMFIISDECFDTEAKKALVLLSKRLIPTGIIIFFIGLLLPDKDTLLLMQAAKLATTDNVNSVFEALKAAMDYAVTILK